jgi:hypothetical protein
MKSVKPPAGVEYDAQGFPCLNDCRLTPCCFAVASCDEHGTTYCKSCYNDVDVAYGNPPAKSADEKMQGPFVVDLRDGSISPLSAKKENRP